MFKKVTACLLVIFMLCSSTVSISAKEVHSRYNKGEMVYLTFDDGPNQYTPKLLDVLKRYDVKATFFILGKKIKGNEAILQRIVDEGHTIGLHSMTHDKNTFYRSPQTAVNEMKQVQQLIFDITGVKSTTIRVPYGSVPHMTKAHRHAMEKAGFDMWDWNVDTLDWKYKKDQKAMRYQTIKQVRAHRAYYQASIVLMHDHATSPESLSYMLRHLTREKFLFLTTEQAKEPYHFYNKWYGTSH